MRLKQKKLGNKKMNFTLGQLELLCGQDMDVAVAALTQRDQVVFACEQQARIFEQLTEELHAENALQASLDLIDLRDRAGWTGPGEKIKQVEAKQLALLADATLDRPADE